VGGDVLRPSPLEDVRAFHQTFGYHGPGRRVASEHGAEKRRATASSFVRAGRRPLPRVRRFRKVGHVMAEAFLHGAVDRPTVRFSTRGPPGPGAAWCFFPRGGVVEPTSGNSHCAGSHCWAEITVARLAREGWEAHSSLPSSFPLFSFPLLRRRRGIDNLAKDTKVADHVAHGGAGAFESRPDQESKIETASEGRARAVTTRRAEPRSRRRWASSVFCDPLRPRAASVHVNRGLLSLTTLPVLTLLLLLAEVLDEWPGEPVSLGERGELIFTASSQGRWAAASGIRNSRRTGASFSLSFPYFVFLPPLPPFVIPPSLSPSLSSIALFAGLETT